MRTLNQLLPQVEAFSLAYNLLPDLVLLLWNPSQYFHGFFGSSVRGWQLTLIKSMDGYGYSILSLLFWIIVNDYYHGND